MGSFPSCTCSIAHERIVVANTVFSTKSMWSWFVSSNFKSSKATAVSVLSLSLIVYCWSIESMISMSSL